MTKLTITQTSLPKEACLPINRCNLPAAILGSLTYQQHPAPLIIDSVHVLYRDIFERLKRLDNFVVRSRHFMDFISVQFQLDSPDEVGHQHGSRLDRCNANYLKLIRGWFFNPDSQEAAVLKGWVESRFGLLPRFHKNPICSPSDLSYRNYVQEWANGLYNTNGLETQLDLLYSYCQFELARKFGNQTHITLYRGCNNISDYETFDKLNDGQRTVLLNNLNSFSASQERADEFGDHIMEVKIPLSKISFYNALMPGMLASEAEYVVIGGLYKIRLIQ